MANMGYCRFTNTLADLMDCFEHMEESDLAPEEKKARERLIVLCQEIYQDYGDDDDGDNENGRD